MRRVPPALLFVVFLSMLLSAIPTAYGQQPIGTFTPGHALRATTTSGAYSDAGGAAGSTAFGQGYLTELGITGTGTPFCINSALISGPYYQFCLGASALGGGLISFNAYGGAAPLGLNIFLNGVSYPFPGPGSGNVIAPTSPTPTAGDAAIWNGGTTVKDGGLSAPHVASLTALSNSCVGSSGCPSGDLVYPAGVWRDDYASGVGAPPLFMRPASSPCSVNDGAACVNSADGKSWLGKFDSAGVDLREWGAIGNSTAGDNTTIAAADSAYGSGLVTVPLRITGTVYVLSAVIDNIPSIIGSGRSTCTLALASSASDTSDGLEYQGTGPFSFTDCTVSAPVYDPSAQSEPAGLELLRIGPPPPANGTQIQFVKLRDLNIVGGQTGIQVSGTKWLDADHIFTDRQYAFGLVVTDVFDGANLQTEHIRLSHISGRGEGQYCVSLPANLPSGAVMAPRDLIATDMTCDASGFIGQKYCWDFPTGTAYTEVVFRGVGTNCFNGGLETKKSNENTSAIPDVEQKVDIDLTYYTSIDSNQQAISIGHEQTSTNANDKGLSVYRVRTFYSPPAAWAASFNYDIGDVRQNGGNVYRVTQAGTAAGSGGPSGTGSSTDGTVIWQYVEAVPTNSVAAVSVGCELEGATDINLDCRVYGMAVGILAFPRGASNTTIERADIHFEGVVQNNCFETSSTVVGTFDRVRFLNWACRVLNLGEFSNNAALYFNGGGQTFTNFEIDGGSFVSEQNGIVFRDSSDNVNLSVTGDPRFEGGNSDIYVDGTGTAVIEIHGGFYKVDNSGSDAPFYATGSTATMDLNVSEPIGVSNASSGSYGSWAFASSAAGYVHPGGARTFVNGNSGTIPTTHCNYGDFVGSQTPGAGSEPVQGWYCSTPGTTWSTL